MNDEEIKAIELLTKRMENLKEYECLYQWKDEIKVLLNLIEKQKAEIEYWKEQAQGYSDLRKQIKEEYEQRLEDYYNEE